MAQYSTSQEAMQQGAAKVDDAASQIQGHLQNLRGEIETMMGGWKGEAANSFMTVHAAFDEQANKINNALRQMHESLMATHATYATQESDQSSALSGLAGQING